MSAKLSELNDAVTVEAGDLLYLVRNNQSFRVAAISFAGAPGEDGEDGDPGAPGADGLNGVNGTNGVNGVNGINGVNGANGVNGQGVPTGGTTGQFLRKQSNTDFDTAFETLVASLISDSTATGRSVLTANNAAVARAAIGAGIGSSNFNSSYTALNDVPSTFPPSAHNHNAVNISDSTTIGRALLTAANNVAARSTLGLGNAAVLNVGNTANTVAAGDHSHPAGSDAWTYVKTGSDFVTNLNTAQNVTGLAFAPQANTDYEFEARLYCRTVATATGPRPGLAWPSGLTDGIANIDAYQAATGAPLGAAGNPNASVLIAAGGLPNATQSWPTIISGTLRAGASPSGNVQVQLASETAGNNVTAKAGSWLKYRTIP